MKKISLKSIKAELADRVLSEEQMSELLGGIKCPYCGGEFSEDQAIRSGTYFCTAKYMGKEISGTIEASSAYHAAIRYDSKFIEGGGQAHLTDIHCVFQGGEYGGY